jgi:drug/metabolite transporter (DMT)-like permease
MLIWLTGVAYTEASVASTINQTSTIFIVLFAALFLDERLTPARIIGTVLGFAGALVVTFG